MIRFAAATDAHAIAAIYAPIVASTPISFEVDPPTPNVIVDRIHKISERWPWLVLETEAGVLGYAYASQHRERAAYRWSVDVSAYVASDVRRRGVGRKLYTSLLAILRLQGYANAFAGIALPNDASVGLHEVMGFTPVGIYRNVGYKLGQWHDVGWWQCALQRFSNDPPAPRPLEELMRTPELDYAVNVGEQS